MSKITFILYAGFLYYRKMDEASHSPLLSALNGSNAVTVSKDLQLHYRTHH